MSRKYFRSIIQEPVYRWLCH